MIKKITFEKGQTAYLSGDIEISINKQEPLKTEEVNIEDQKEAQKFLDSPNEYQLKKVKNKFQVLAKSKVKKIR